MTFRKIDYLEWARTHMGRVKYDLAKSNVKDVTAEDLDLSLDQIPLNAPDVEGLPELRSLLAGRYGVSPANLLVTGGATMAIYLACAAVLQEGHRLILESPYYEPLLRCAEERGADVKFVERRFERGWQIDLEEMERQVGRGTGAVFLTNLHNPSGVATGPEKLMSLGQLARDYGTSIISSEVYLDNAFVPGLKPAASFGSNMVSIGSLSKNYGLGGLRIGWIVASESVIEKARVILDYLECDLSAPSEGIALAALKRADALIERSRRIASANFKIVGEWIARRGDVAWVEPEGGTVCMVRLPRGVDAKKLSTRLREDFSTLVVPGEFFGVRGFVRISCGGDEEPLRKGLKNVGTAIDKLKDRPG